MLASRRDSSRDAERVASRIVDDVRRRGDAALFSCTKRFDRVALTAKNVWVSRAEFKQGQRKASREISSPPSITPRATFAPWPAAEAAQNGISKSSRACAPASACAPIESIGCYLPGGRFSLVSTLLMTVIPAQEAGVRADHRRQPPAWPRAAGRRRTTSACDRSPASAARRPSPRSPTARARFRASIKSSAPAIASSPPRSASSAPIAPSTCSPAPPKPSSSPTRGNPQFIAADLIAQAEHDPDAISIFVTTSRASAKEVAAEIDRQLASCRRSNLARRSLAKSGAVLVARNLADGRPLRESFRAGAPDACPAASSGLLDRIDSAGSIFLGDWSAQTFGDYASGTNHVLPTGGVARTRGGLSVSDFVKCISVQEVSRRGFRAPRAGRRGIRARRRPGRARPLRRGAQMKPPVPGPRRRREDARLQSAARRPHEKTAPGLQREPHRLLARSPPGARKTHRRVEISLLSRAGNRAPQDGASISASARTNCCSPTAPTKRCTSSSALSSSPATRVLLVEPTYAMYRFYSELAGARDRRAALHAANANFPWQRKSSTALRSSRAARLFPPQSEQPHRQPAFAVGNPPHPERREAHHGRHRRSLFRIFRRHRDSLDSPPRESDRHAHIFEDRRPRRPAPRLHFRRSRAGRQHAQSRNRPIR